MKQSAQRNSRGSLVLVLLATCMVLAGKPLAQVVQEARVAVSTIRIEPVAGKKEIQVSLRLVDTPSITGATATFGTGAAQKPVPVSWTSFESIPPANCAWLIVVDNSNPARQQTVEACVAEVRAFLALLPKGDAVMVASLSRDLVVESPFESAQGQRDTALAAIKADGEASLTTLIYQNVKHGLADHLARRSETRKCVVLLTDGKDETPGGPVAVKARRDELITEAKKLGIPIHSFGFAEKATEANYFADLKEAALQTDGLHVPAVVATRQLAPDTWPKLIGVMHGGGTALLDVSALTEAASVKLELTSESGKKASVLIPHEVVAQALHVDLPPATAVKFAHSPSESATPMMPVWGWGAVSVALLAVIALASRRNKTGTVVDMNQKAAAVRTEPVAVPRASVPVIEHASIPPACVELCDAKKTRHTVMAKGARIGSGKHNDIVIKDDSVSESHCLISMKNGEWTIADLESANSVRVNGTYYHQASLSANDLIQLGEVQMRFLVES
ncbi:MAG: FHA domain-containing protein [Prosthecobacter sp.]|uniref:FHA domain-containing protein n=1 Tax=Prosthecobacter sp. TaxID=1965333 RepID=UPI0038FE85FD